MSSTLAPAIILACLMQPPLPAAAAEATGSALIGGKTVAEQADASKLRICAAGNELPFSSKDQTGFENRIASVVAKAMGREPVFVFADKPAIYLVRDWLDKGRCDVVVGLDSGDQRVLTTKPYYRAGYVFVTRKDRNIELESWEDPQIKSVGHIVVEFGSPSEVMLKEIGKYTDNMAYLYSLVGFRSPRNQYTQIPPQKIVSEVESGNAGVAAVFAPDIARYVKANAALKMVPIKDDADRDGERIPQQYDQSMGVRHGDEALLVALDTALEKVAPEIADILRDEGIPILKGQSSN
ncbi:methanol oxidation system protein MoxJ [Bradyrhizobium ontarionense]|uniref:Methanol oxidation system protein MoxJ n=1 Tax=Bradyrhizobium ontarionense TaxID=2898149 RepID=A0ABY3R5U3_9BRAD|nr:methanol oxidation system protein MoxJ [Bradyrhizobium sp. A19]UFZ02678.1 methanol oxidation system protein MoxJ [Bradyrhizobium sp. A19]